MAGGEKLSHARFARVPEEGGREKARAQGRNGGRALIFDGRIAGKVSRLYP